MDMSNSIQMSPVKPGVEGEEVEETSPCGRWCRYARTGGAGPSLVAKGSFKEVYKGFDTHLGMEVAWNVVNEAHSENLQDQVVIDRIMREFQIMKSTDCKHIVKCYGGWRNPQTGAINFITELFTSGSLRSYRWKHTDMDIQLALNKWGRNVLSGLAYLHSKSPPIVHRDLRCDYCFINGNTGEVKIADLGRATFMRESNLSQTATQTKREFAYIAPELYSGRYTSEVDIYSFGLLLLELVSLERPYAEYKTPAQLSQAVESGKLPLALEKVQDTDLVAIIQACLARDPTCRPSASELLQLEYFREMMPDEVIQVSGTVEPEAPTCVKLQVKISRPGVNRNVCNFEYNTDTDDAREVANEMMTEIHLTKEEASVVARKIKDQVAKLCPESTPVDTELKLVRVPSETGIPDKASVRVLQPDPAGAPQNYHIEFHSLVDRRELLFDILDVIYSFPLSIMSAVYSTEKGAVIEDFEVTVSKGQQIDSTELEERLTAAL